MEEGGGRGGHNWTFPRQPTMLSARRFLRLGYVDTGGAIKCCPKIPFSLLQFNFLSLASATFAIWEKNRCSRNWGESLLIAKRPFAPALSLPLCKLDWRKLCTEMSGRERVQLKSKNSHSACACLPKKDRKTAPLAIRSYYLPKAENIIVSASAKRGGGGRGN